MKHNLILENTVLAEEATTQPVCSRTLKSQKREPVPKVLRSWFWTHCASKLWKIAFLVLLPKRINGTGCTAKNLENCSTWGNWEQTLWSLSGGYYFSIVRTVFSWCAQILKSTLKKRHFNSSTHTPPAPSSNSCVSFVIRLLATQTWRSQQTKNQNNVIISKQPKISVSPCTKCFQIAVLKYKESLIWKCAFFILLWQTFPWCQTVPTRAW